VAAPRVSFAFDFVDPGSYLAHEVLEAWRRDHPSARLEVDWEPLELRVPGREPIDGSSPAWLELQQSMMALAGELGLPFRPPSRIPWTRKAHEVALLGVAGGVGGLVHTRLFRAHFVEGEDIGRIDVLIGLGKEVGLDGGELRTVLGIDREAEEVERMRSELLARGVTGVPIFQWGGRRLAGFRSAEELVRFLEEVDG